MRSGSAASDVAGGEATESSGAAASSGAAVGDLGPAASSCGANNAVGSGSAAPSGGDGGAGASAAPAPYGAATPSPRGVGDGCKLGTKGRAWVRHLGPATTIGCVPGSKGAGGESQARFAQYESATTIGMFLDLHPGDRTQANKGLCHDAEKGLIRISSAALLGALQRTAATFATPVYGAPPPAVVGVGTSQLGHPLEQGLAVEVLPDTAGELAEEPHAPVGGKGALLRRIAALEATQGD